MRQCPALVTTVVLLASAVASSVALSSELEGKVASDGSDRGSAFGGEANVLPNVLLVRFREGLDPEFEDRISFLSKEEADSLRALQLTLKSVGAASWRRAFPGSVAKLRDLRLHAKRSTDRAIEDLSLHYLVVVSEGNNAVEVIERLRGLPEVRDVRRVPRPAPLPTVGDLFSPSHTNKYQRYQDSAPDGLGTRELIAQSGESSEGVSVCDVEYSFNRHHFELSSVAVVGPAGTDPFGDDNHGTAVLATMGALSDGVGTSGMAGGATLFFAHAHRTDESYPVAAAILECLDATLPGDVILIEQQTWGPIAQSFAPSEWDQTVYDVVVSAVASGRIVVAAAGNGGEDLGSAHYASGNGGHSPFLPENDSGAILVGAGGSPYSNIWRSAWDFSNFGTRVNLQGWGDSVVTAGYGDLHALDGKNFWYTASFSGTSSAAPMVAAVAAIVQSHYKRTYNKPLTSQEMRTILQRSGTPHVGSKYIGPLPDVLRALSELGIK